MAHVGVRCSFEDFNLHRELLLFDRLALPKLETALRVWTDGRSEDMARRAANLEWLAQRDVVFVPEIRSLHEGPAASDYQQYLNREDEFRQILQSLAEYAKQHPPTDRDELEQLAELFATLQNDTGENLLNRINENARLSSGFLARAVALDLTATNNASAIPIVAAADYHLTPSTYTKADVLTIAISKLPLPSEDVPLEQILDFRANPDVRLDFLELHGWAASLAKQNTSLAEMSEEVEYLLERYRRHMRLHKMKEGSGVLETVVTVTTEALEDLVKFKWADAAKLIFSLKRRNVALMEAEATAPGREIAYLVKAATALNP